MIKAITNIAQEFPTILELYKSVGWDVYAEEPEELMKALQNSTYLYGHYKEGLLNAIIRGMSDDSSIHYIQDIIVNQKLHNQGIGTKLVDHVLKALSHVRAHILLTDDEAGQLAFYKKLKFYNTKELKQTPLNCFVQYPGLDLS